MVLCRFYMITKNKVKSYMLDAWDLKTDDKRVEDRLPTFIIFCEDTVSEPIYFKYFETSKIKVNTIENQKSKTENVFNAICYCEDNEITDLKDIHVWCVYDRDIEENIVKIRKGNINFDESIKTAESKGYNVAWSNDAFELWILLHFEEIDHTDILLKNRKEYYKRLTEIFKNYKSKNEDLLKAISNPRFNYKDHFKNKNNFRGIVREEVVNKTIKAISRAKKLENEYNVENPSHEKSPCTMVHHLVSDLIKYGGRKVK